MSYALQSEDMASLNDKDRKWLAEQISIKVEAAFQDSSLVANKISEAILPFRVTGWRRAGQNIVAIGSPVAIFAVFLTLFGVTLAAVYQSFGHVEKETEFRTATKDRLDTLDKDVIALRVLISASQPLRKQNQYAAKEVLIEARQSAIPIPAQVVE